MQEEECEIQRMKAFTILGEWLHFHRLIIYPNGCTMLYSHGSWLAYPFVLCGVCCGTRAVALWEMGDLSQKLYVLSKKSWPLGHSVHMKQPFPSKMITGLGVFVSAEAKGDFCPHVVCPSVSVILRTNLSWFGFACSYAYFQKTSSSIKIAKIKDFKTQKVSCCFRYFTADVLFTFFFPSPLAWTRKRACGLSHPISHPCLSIAVLMLHQ